jgi:hypothetical protein
MAFGTKRLAGAFVNRAGKNAYNASIAASKAANINPAIATPKAMNAMDAAMRARQATAMSTARKVVYGGGAALSASVATAAKPNANQSRTSYRGPMQTGRGSGRYA